MANYKLAEQNLKRNPYKQHLGLTLTEMGSLLGLSKEAIRMRFARMTKYKYYRKVITEQREEIQRLKEKISTLQCQPQPVPQQLSLFPEHQQSPEHQQGFDYIKNRSLRTHKLVERLGFTSLLDIHHYGMERLAREPNIGQTSLWIIEEGLRMGGLDPRETVLRTAVDTSEHCAIIE